jgi:hypothetical protein
VLNDEFYVSVKAKNGSYLFSVLEFVAVIAVRCFKAQEGLAD